MSLTLICTTWLILVFGLYLLATFHSNLKKPGFHYTLSINYLFICLIPIYMVVPELLTCARMENEFINYSTVLIYTFFLVLSFMPCEVVSVVSDSL